MTFAAFFDRSTIVAEMEGTVTGCPEDVPGAPPVEITRPTPAKAPLIVNARRRVNSFSGRGTKSSSRRLAIAPSFAEVKPILKVESRSVKYVFQHALLRTKAYPEDRNPLAYLVTASELGHGHTHPLLRYNVALVRTERGRMDRTELLRLARVGRRRLGLVSFKRRLGLFA